MTEANVGFLFKAASSLQQHKDNHTITKLRSYYLLRCNELTKGYGLPERYFSAKARCTRCCVEWRSGTKIEIKPIKLSKKQRRKLRSKKPTKKSKDWVEKSKMMLHTNELEQTCTFCNTVTKTTVPKPEPININKINQRTTTNNEITTMKIRKQESKTDSIEKAEMVRVPDKEAKNTKSEMLKYKEINVYNQTKHVFSMKNSNNAIKSSVKEKPKVIKNNKKKKDKFAGLCQKAVLASVKLKEDSQKQNKLNLFLKPSK